MTDNINEEIEESEQEEIHPGSSHRATNDKAFEIIESLVSEYPGGEGLSILDFGSGRGHMCQRVGNMLKGKGISLADTLHACEIKPEYFEYKGVECKEIGTGTTLPFEDNSMSLIYAIEVVEHTLSPYNLFEEAFRVLKKGGVLIFSVPNILHMQSRIKFLLTGSGELYPPPSVDPTNAGLISGHIMPLSYAYHHYGLKRAGFTDIGLEIDKVKRSSRMFTLLLYPLIVLGNIYNKRYLTKADPKVWEEVRHVSEELNSYKMLTSRSCIIVSRKK